MRLGRTADARTVVDDARRITEDLGIPVSGALVTVDRELTGAAP